MSHPSQDKLNVDIVDFDIFRDSILLVTPMIRLARAFMKQNFEAVSEQALKFGEFNEFHESEGSLTRIVEVNFGADRGPIYFLISSDCSEDHKSALGDFILFIEKGEKVLASSEFLKDYESLKTALLPTEPIWLFKGVGFYIIIPNYSALSFNFSNTGDL